MKQPQRTKPILRWPGGKSRLLKTILPMSAANQRLDKVVIENISYERIFKNYDSDETFFFIDPPYINAPTGAYDGWKEADAILLKKNLRRLKGKWLVTINDSPFTRDLFMDCKTESVVSKSQTVNNATNPNATFGELIITPK